MSASLAALAFVVWSVALAALLLRPGRDPLPRVDWRYLRAAR